MVDHLIPKTLLETLDFMSKYDALVVSGGTDIMVQKRNWAETKPLFPKKVVYIFNVEELNYIKKIDNHIHIGAVTPMSDILEHKDTPKLLKDAISIIASPALRNAATLAGNIGNASPAGDTLPVLYVCGAMLVIENKDHQRIVPIEEVILGPRKTTIASDELITEIIIPLHHFTKSNFVKVGGRKADAISKVSFAGAVKIEDNRTTDFRISFGAVSPVIIRDRDIEESCIGLTTQELHNKVNEIIANYSKLITPIDDQRSNKVYRKKVAINLLQEFILNI